MRDFAITSQGKAKAAKKGARERNRFHWEGVHMRRWMKRLGCTAAELLVVTAILASIPTGQYRGALNRTYETNCFNNMKTIGTGLQMYLINNGTFPKAKFYPKDPRGDGQSIVVLLKGEVPARAFVCPSLPGAICDRGLCFLWNDEFSGKDPSSVPGGGNKWVMVEICAADTKSPAPHRGGYHVLYADGNVSWTNKAPWIKASDAAPKKPGTKSRLRDMLRLAFDGLFMLP